MTDEPSESEVFGMLLGLIEIEDIPVKTAAGIIKRETEADHETVDKLIEEHWT